MLWMFFSCEIYKNKIKKQVTIHQTGDSISYIAVIPWRSLTFTLLELIFPSILLKNSILFTIILLDLSYLSTSILHIPNTHTKESMVHKMFLHENYSIYCFISSISEEHNMEGGRVTWQLRNLTNSASARWSGLTFRVTCHVDRTHSWYDENGTVPLWLSS